VVGAAQLAQGGGASWWKSQPVNSAFTSARLEAGHASNPESKAQTTRAPQRFV
jgi:hypothetical protein